MRSDFLYGQLARLWNFKSMGGVTVARPVMHQRLHAIRFHFDRHFANE